MFIRTATSRLLSSRNLPLARVFCYAVGVCIFVFLEMANGVMCLTNRNNNEVIGSMISNRQDDGRFHRTKYNLSGQEESELASIKYDLVDVDGGDIKRLNKSQLQSEAPLQSSDNQTTPDEWPQQSKSIPTNIATSGGRPKKFFEDNDSGHSNLDLGGSSDLLRVSKSVANDDKRLERTNPLVVYPNNSATEINEQTALMQLKRDSFAGFPMVNESVIRSGEPAQARKSLRSVASQLNQVHQNYNFDNGHTEHGEDDDNDLIGSAESKQKFENDLNCALILKRTYILNNKNNNNEHGGDEWGDKYVFNDSDPDDDTAASGVDKKKIKKRKKSANKNEKNIKKKKQELIHKTDLCIKHSDVDKAIEEAKHQLKFKQSNDLQSLDISMETVAQVGELNLLASSLLMQQFDLSPDEILNALPMIDMSSSKFYWNDLCPKHVRPMVCIKSRYRTITAHCNNLRHPSWGAAKTPYARYLPPDYADGIGKPRASRVDGRPLPSARLISSLIHTDSDEPSHDYSILFADWGQLLNHDITRVAVGKAPDCCPHYLKGLCMPIPVPDSDPLYSKFKVKCLKFDRSLPAMRPRCLLGVRSPFNLITSSVDASFVYGSTKQQAASLRTFSDGKLKVWNYFDGKLKLKPLLPPQLEKPDDECLGRPKDLYCFLAGDVRVNEQTHLTVLHTIYVREHNRLAKLLGQMNLDWDDDKIYHETRHIVAACVQHVMINEFLPLLLGPKLMGEYGLGPILGNGNDNYDGDLYWHGYDSSVTISTGAGFAAAAFRYGHSMIESKIRRLDPKSGTLIGSELLRFLLKRPFVLYEPGAIDQLIMGMLLTPAEQTDPFMSEELSGHLFQPPKAKFGHDLAAINIQRGRDKGIPGYNYWREWCGLSRAKSFEDLEPLLMNSTAWKFEQIYKHVDDIDLWSAGISERKLPGATVGPTMACIIARQFMNYKRGDRFWYENPNQPSSFSQQQLREIKKVKLAKILCTNSDDIPMIQPWAMRLPHPIYNARVPCESLPSINLKYWDSNNF